MSEATIGIRTEVYGLELHLSAAQLVLAAGGQSLTAPIVLSTDDANRLRMEFAKVQLWEWNQFEELKSRPEKRYRHCLVSWLVLCHEPSQSPSRFAARDFSSSNWFHNHNCTFGNSMRRRLAS